MSTYREKVVEVFLVYLMCLWSKENSCVMTFESSLWAGDDRHTIDVQTDNLIATSNYVHFCIMIVV